jgi:hypothetical protein
MPTEQWRSDNQDKMRQYRRDWYQRNKAFEIEKAKLGKAEQVKRNVQITIDERAKPCTDCKVEYPYYVMEFDHISDDKTGGICKMARRPVSEAKLRAEIDKCEVVCSNCHAARTWSRANQ